MTAINRTPAWLLRGSAVAAMAVCSVVVQAQTAVVAATPEATASPFSLRQVFDAAWARQPQAQALQARRDAARALQQAAKAWTPEPAALELSTQTDRLNRNQGALEVEVGVAVPLWLPGRRSRSAALADAENAATESRASVAQLRLAATVRDAWWQWQRAGSKQRQRAAGLTTHAASLPTWRSERRLATWPAPTNTRLTAQWPAPKPAWPRPRPAWRRRDSICRPSAAPHPRRSTLSKRWRSLSPALP